MPNTTPTSGGQTVDAEQRILPSPALGAQSRTEGLADLAPLIEQCMHTHHSETRKTLRVEQRFEFKQFIVRSLLLTVLMALLGVAIFYFLKAERFDIAENAFYAILGALGTLGAQWIGPTRSGD